MIATHSIHCENYLIIYDVNVEFTILSQYDMLDKIKSRKPVIISHAGPKGRRCSCFFLVKGVTHTPVPLDKKIIDVAIL